MPEPILLDPTRQALEREMGGIRDFDFQWRELFSWDTVRFFDDFLGEQLMNATADGDPGVYVEVTGVDGAFDILADSENGAAQLQASVGAGADNEYGGVSLANLTWKGDLSLMVAARLQIDAITTVKVEFGVTDVSTDAGAALVLATPTATADDAALWVIGRARSV